MKEETTSDATTIETPTPKAHRTRHSRKRPSFRRLPPPAPSVRGLWIAASDEERSKAHRLCMAILEYWLGRATKEEIAERLELTPLRVWQLSQQALSGMLVGLLRLPRSRARLVESSAHPPSDTTSLRKRIAELEKKLARTEDLVRVLKHLPWQTEGGNGRPAKKRPSRRKSGKKSAEPTSEASDREMAGSEATGG